METQIATSPSQSQRLIACGVDPKTADMYWRFPLTLVGKRNHEIYLLIRDESELRGDDIPAWSLSALLSLLPPTISGENDEEMGDYDLFIYPSMTGKNWTVCYSYTEDGYSDYLLDVKDSSIIEACVKAIEWLTKEGYKLNEIE